MFNQKRSAVARINLSQAIKDKILENQERKCNLCEKDMKKWEFDHIVPLPDGGDNNIENIQALCKECHEIKSNKEDIDRFFKTDALKSSYNNITKPIFTKARNAFISGDCTDDYDDELLGGLDINKCRRNILGILNTTMPFTRH